MPKGVQARGTDLATDQAHHPKSHHQHHCGKSDKSHRLHFILAPHGDHHLPPSKQSSGRMVPLRSCLPPLDPRQRLGPLPLLFAGEHTSAGNLRLGKSAPSANGRSNCFTRSWTCSECPIRAADLCSVLRRDDTAASFINLCVCRALASRPRLSSRRGVSRDVIPHECAGSTTDISACVTGCCSGCRNHETEGYCDDKRPNRSEGTKRRLVNFTHVKTP